MDQSSYNRNWVVERYSKYDNGQWLPSPLMKKILLSLQGAYLLIAQDGLALETINLVSGPKIISTEHMNRTVVVYLDYNKGKMSKFRVQFQTQSEANTFFQIMRKYSNHRNEGSMQVINLEESLSSVIEKIMKKDSDDSTVAPELDPSYSLESAVRLCILDPGFPKFVNEVEKIIDSISNKF